MSSKSKGDWHGYTLIIKYRNYNSREVSGKGGRWLEVTRSEEGGMEGKRDGGGRLRDGWEGVKEEGTGREGGEEHREMDGKIIERGGRRAQ